MTKQTLSGRIVKYRLVTYWEEIPNQVTPQGEPVLVERVASMGEKIFLRPQDEARLDSLDALYTDDDAQAIEEGSYRGFDAATLERFRGGMLAGPSPILPVEGEGPQVQNLSTEELADYIHENRLNVDQTVALAGDDLESIEKVLDAENIATDNDPRKGVTDRLEAKMSAVTQS